MVSLLNSFQIRRDRGDERGKRHKPDTNKMYSTNGEGNWI